MPIIKYLDKNESTIVTNDNLVIEVGIFPMKFGFRRLIIHIYQLVDNLAFFMIAYIYIYTDKRKLREVLQVYIMIESSNILIFIVKV